MLLEMNLYAQSEGEHAQRLGEFSGKKVEKELLDDEQ